jgi:hypothetical protein
MSGSGDFTCSKGSDKNISLPLGKFVARVESHSRDGNRRHPIDDRCFESLAHELVGLPGAGIRAAEAHKRPSVIAAGFEDIDFVPTVGTVFIEPHLARSGMHCKAQ